MCHPKSGINENYVNGLASVIIPTHNRAELLNDTLNSVAQQSYRPIEIVVIDDDSTDHTKALVEQFKTKNASSDFIIHYAYFRYKNASLCRNEGLRRCQGEFIQFLDSDDVIHPDKIKKQIELLANEQLDFVWSSTIQFSHQPDWNTQVYVGGEYNYATHNELTVAFIRKSLWRTDSGLFKRSACIRTGLWSAISMFQDWEYHIRLLAWHPKIAHLNNNLSAARQHNQGRIGDKWKNGTGLDGALHALKNVTVATIFSCKNNSDWQNAILTRALEIQQQSQKTDNAAVEVDASAFIHTLRSLCNVQLGHNHDVQV